MGSPVEANNLRERGESMAAEFRATRVTLPRGCAREADPLLAHESRVV